MILGIDKVDIQGYDSLISVCDKYIGSLWQIKCSLATAVNVMIRVRDGWKFHWTSSLSSQNKKKYYGFDVFVYEISMVLIVKAFGLISKASNLSEESLEKVETSKEYLVKAAKLWRTTAGILNLVRTKLIPQWRSRPKELENYPFELNESCLLQLEQECLINAQNCTIVVALQKVNLNNEEIVKSSNGKQSLRTIIMLLKGSIEFILKVEETNESLLLISLFQCIITFLKGLENHSNTSNSLKPDQEAVKAVEFLNYSKYLMNNVTKIFKLCQIENKSGKNGYLNKLKTHLNIFSEEIKSIFQEYKENNEKIYFGSIENFSVKEEINKLKGAFLPKLIETELPKINTLSFERKETVEKKIEEQVEKNEIESEFQQLNLNENGIDMEVFKHLPPDIQEEVRTSLKNKDSRQKTYF